QTQVATGQVAVQINGNGETVVLDPGNVDQLNHYLMNLSPGVYWLRVTSLGSEPALVQWTLRPPAVDWEKLMDNGVGQAPALSWTLVESVSTSTQAAAPSGTLVESVSTSTAATPSPVQANLNASLVASIGAGPNSHAIPAASIPTSLLVTLET